MQFFFWYSETLLHLRFDFKRHARTDDRDLESRHLPVITCRQKQLLNDRATRSETSQRVHKECGGYGEGGRGKKFLKTNLNIIVASVLVIKRMDKENGDGNETNLSRDHVGEEGI